MTTAVNRTAVERRHRCGATVLTGHDDDWAALVITVDVAPLTRRGEAGVLLAGRTTAEVASHGTHRHITHRDHWRITGHPADTVAVVAEHRCDAPTPAAWLAAQTIHRSGPVPSATGPPF